MNSEVLNTIAQFRAARKISQQELADAISVSRKTISTVETCRFTPSITIALKLAKYFDTSVENLFILVEPIQVD